MRPGKKIRKGEGEDPFFTPQSDPVSDPASTPRPDPVEPKAPERVG